MLGEELKIPKMIEVVPPIQKVAVRKSVKYDHTASLTEREE